MVFVFVFLPTFVYASALEVFVSILPQKYFIQRIGGEQVTVNVMVKPGQSPETFEPSPKLMTIYSRADVYFTIGMPFEQVWIDRVASLNPAIAIKSTQPEVTKRLRTEHEHHDKHRHSWDPHTWLSPVIAAHQAEIIMLELSRLSPGNSELFYNNYIKLKKELDKLHNEFSKRFKSNEKTSFVTFHPAFSYFAQQYGLHQIAIEVDGKEPSAKQIAQIVQEIKDKDVSYILVERQFNQLIPGTIARAVNAELLVIDPLALDYIKNMRDIADKISKAVF